MARSLTSNYWDFNAGVTLVHSGPKFNGIEDEKYRYRCSWGQRRWKRMWAEGGRTISEGNARDGPSAKGHRVAPPLFNILFTLVFNLLHLNALDYPTLPSHFLGVTTANPLPGALCISHAALRAASRSFNMMGQLRQTCAALLASLDSVFRVPANLAQAVHVRHASAAHSAASQMFISEHPVDGITRRVLHASKSRSLHIAPPLGWG
ncbi:hypothetical protein B0H13DRAFT_1908224 [Mycena leptocephala]|nr:hypothetical protein B0H13DRAFT_1908224 [Mycena leptocephala]